MAVQSKNYFAAAASFIMILSCACTARQLDFTRVVIDENIGGRTTIGDTDGDGYNDIVTARSWDKAPIQLWRDTVKNKK